MTAPDTTAKSKTARHFDEGATVYHKTHGYGIIMVGFDGEKYPRFDATKTTGTSATRVWPTDCDER